MINTLDEYICSSIPMDMPFQTNPNLLKKVDSDGHFLEFSGNTVVFTLDESTKKKLSDLQDSLYTNCSDLLSDRLSWETFHMTLHDLVNAPGGVSGISERMDMVSATVRQILRPWKDMPALRMRTTWLFNMVNTSIVLGLAPADQDSYCRLDQMYCRLEEELRLGYAMTPHITMAYFKPGSYGDEACERLRQALRPVEMEICLDMSLLVLQNFSYMNHYFTIN
jgi:hypothetical protein